MDQVNKKMPIRNHNICPVFGKSKVMSKNLLPTYRDVIQHFMSVRQELTDV